VGEEVDEFFRFMISNDFSGEEEEELLSATDVFPEFDYFDAI
jgi:hypothetical protein